MDTLSNPTVKRVPASSRSDDAYDLVVENDPSGTDYREVVFVPKVFVPSPRVHIVNDPSYNTAGKLEELGTSDRPYNATAVNELRDIIHSLPSGSRVMVGPGIYEFDLSFIPGRLFAGLDIRNDLHIEGSGRGGTIFRVADGSTGLTGGNSLNNKSLISVGGKNGDTDESDVLIANLTLDCNITNAIPNGGRLVHNALVTGCRKFHGENLDIIGCGSDPLSLGEEFSVFCVSRASGFGNQVTLRNIDHYNEGIPQGSDPTLPNSHTAMTIGGDVDGSWTDGLVENYRIIKTISGVGMGLLRSENGVTFRDCVIDGRGVNGRGPGNACIPWLHDTGIAKKTIIDSCVLYPQEFSSPIVIDGPADDHAIIRGCHIVLGNAQAGGQVVIRAGSGALIKVHDNIISGVSNNPGGTSLCSHNPNAGPANAHVHNNTADPAALSKISTVGNEATLQYNNYFLDGSPIPLT